MTKSSKALVTLQSLNPIEAFKPGGMKAVVKDIKTQAKAMITEDLETKQGREQVRTVAALVASSKTFVNETRLEQTKKFREKITEINDEGNAGVEALQDLQDEIRKPLTDYEAIIKKREQELENSLETLLTISDFEGLEPDSSMLSSSVKELDDHYKNTSWEGAEDRASHSYDRIKTKLKARLQGRIQYESDQEELRVLREQKEAQLAKDEEDRIKQEAADLAKKEAEEKAQKKIDDNKKIAADNLAAEKLKKDKAIQDKKDAEAKVKKAEADKKAAAKKAEDDKIAAKKQADKDKADAIQAEKDRVAAEEKRIADETALREENIKHKKGINESILAGFHEQMTLKPQEEELLKTFLNFIANKKIPFITINY